MKIAFFGTGNFSKNILENILKFENIDLLISISQPDKPIGRKRILEKTPIKKFSQEKNIKCLQPENLKSNFYFLEELKNLDLDFIIVVAYGKIIPKEILKIPKYGCINIHGSILPKYRGASPIQESLKNGDKKTGLTIMYMNEKMDEGDILKIKEIKIDNKDKTPDIFKKFEKIGPKLLFDTLTGIIHGKIQGIPQNNNLSSYCGKILKDDGKIEFGKNTLKQIYNKFRAFYPWPGIYIFFKNKKLIIENCEIYNSSYNDGNLKTGTAIKIDKKNIGIITFDRKVLILRQVKLEGKRSMDIFTFLNGNKDFIGSSF